MRSNILTSDVLIVGGGPAGSACAIEARRLGLRATIVDKSTFPRDKFCGDGLTADALRRLEDLGVDPSRMSSFFTVEQVTVRTTSGRQVSYPLPHDGLFGAVVRRDELDVAILDRARDMGADVLEGVAVTGLDAADDRMTATLEDGRSVQARYVIGADGVWSPTRKMLGLGDRSYRGEFHAFRQYYSNVSDELARGLWVWFEPEILPGYVWAFPESGGRANVGFGIHRDCNATREMKALWPELLSRPHIARVLGPDATPDGPHRAWPIPARLDGMELTAGRVLFVGDAAAATDPMTGEGIAQALLTGTLAARAVAAAGPADAAAASHRYEAAVRRSLMPDFLIAKWLGRLMRTELGVRGAARASGMTDWTRRNFARWLLEDYPRAVVFTPTRWRRELFTAPGAYRTLGPAPLPS